MTRTLRLEDLTDRFANLSDHMILDTAVCVSKKHRTLPPEDAPSLALAIEEFSKDWLREACNDGSSFRDSERLTMLVSGQMEELLTVVLSTSSSRFANSSSMS